MSKLRKVTIAALTLALFALPAFAGQLDDYYLEQFGEKNTTTALQKAVLLSAPVDQPPAKCGTPLKHSLRQDWNLLDASTQKILAKQLALPVLSGERTFTSSAGNFRIHYATSGNDAPPLASADGTTPDWIKTVAATFENVRTFYQNQGYHLPPSLPYEIYIREMSGQGLYGLTNSGDKAPVSGYPNAFTSWMELDNNYTDTIYKPAQYSALQSLQITAAHEYHHSIQYAYNYYFDIWYAEATSSWYEDEIYDDVNQSYNYIAAWFRNSRLVLDTTVSTTNGGGYGRWIFNRYLAEKHGTGVIRSIWEKLAGIAPTNNADIPMAPVIESVLSTSYSSSLGTDFFGFAKKVYTRDWTTHQSDLGLIPTYTPVSTFSTYPVGATSVTLPHYSFAYYKFMPLAGAPVDITITVNGTSGIKATAYKNNAGTISEFAFNSVNGTSMTIPGFSTSTEVALLIANTTSADNHTANFSTDNSGASLTEPDNPAASGGSSSGGGGGGCFIATAAYGSYLHPQVQTLRDFRDNHLLTNAPGRAFVEVYYRYSPPIANLISRHEILRTVVRLLLTPVICAVANPLMAAATLALLITAFFGLYRKTGFLPRREQQL